MKPVLSSPERRKSRVRRLCIWCETHIQAGQRYCHWLDKDADGDIVAMTAHEECHAAADRELEWFGPDGITWDEMHTRGMTRAETMGDPA